MDNVYSILIEEKEHEINITVDNDGSLFTVSELLDHLKSKYDVPITIMITNPFSDNGLYSELREKADKDILVIYNMDDSPK